jgi:hypothetical protein
MNNFEFEAAKAVEKFIDSEIGEWDWAVNIEETELNSKEDVAYVLANVSITEKDVYPVRFKVTEENGDLVLDVQISPDGDYYRVDSYGYTIRNFWLAMLGKHVS